MAPMPRTPPFDLSTLILAGLALTFGLVAYWKDRIMWRVTTGRLASSVMAASPFDHPSWLVTPLQ
jgi:hypothetical protein